jgi:predicted dehydrogenase
MNKIKVAVIGFGYWGPNIVRNFNSQLNCDVAYVVDSSDERLAVVNKNYPNTKTTKNLDDVTNNSSIDAVIIATPVFTHYEIAKKALCNGKHVLIEKPMTSSVKEADELINLSIKYKKVLMVDHTFLYTGSVQKISSIIKDDFIGKVKYVDSTRINLGLFQPDVNVLWDLAPHDISIVNHIVDDKPYSVQAVGVSHTNNNIENIAYLTLNYDSNMIAHFHCSWTSPVKIRKFLIGGERKMIAWDDMEPTEKIKVYDTSYSHSSNEEKRKILVDYRVGDIYVPKVPNNEALSELAKDFLSSISDGTDPISNYISGINVIKVLEASQISIKKGGKEVKVNYS